MSESTNSPRDDKLEEIATEFLRMFEVVFHYDWSYTTSIIGCVDRWHRKNDDGTIDALSLLQTGWEDDDNEIKCLSGLLDTYRKFVRALKERGVEPLVSNPPSKDWHFDRYDWPNAWKQALGVEEKKSDALAPELQLVLNQQIGFNDETTRRVHIKQFLFSSGNWADTELLAALIASGHFRDNFVSGLTHLPDHGPFRLFEITPERYQVISNKELQLEWEEFCEMYSQKPTSPDHVTKLVNKFFPSLADTSTSIYKLENTLDGFWSFLRFIEFVTIERTRNQLTLVVLTD